MKSRQRRWKRGFTLIELLIVVAIIAILALIAVPNFLEAQIRAKTSRVRADFRSLATAEEAYYVDWNSYTNRDQGDDPVYTDGFTQLTSPVAYITTIPNDPFGEHRWPGNGSRRWSMFELGTGVAGVAPSGPKTSPNRNGFPSNTWMMSSAGPDNLDDTQSNVMGFRFTEGHYPWPDLPDTEQTAIAMSSIVYDPTNGTVSTGQIFRAGGMKPAGKLFDVLWRAGSKDR